MSTREPETERLAEGKKRLVFSVKSAFFWSELIRKFVQVSSFILLGGTFVGLSVSPMVLPILWTLGSPYKTVGEAFGTIQGFIFSLVFPWIPLASIALFAAFTGRTLCGWVCPFGLVQDLFGYFKGKKNDVSPGTHRNLLTVKYLVLAATLIIGVALAADYANTSGPVYGKTFGEFAKAPFTTLSPSDTLFAVIPEMGSFLVNNGYQKFLASMLSVPLLIVRLVILVAVLALAVYVQRSWCLYFCPQGAFLALLGRFSFLGLRREPLKCTKATCRICVEVCPTKVPILDLPWEKFTDSECIFCLRCVTACETKAIRPRFP